MSTEKRLVAIVPCSGIGFAFGKEVTLRRLQAREPGTSGEKPDASGLVVGPTDQVIVYYFHGTVRCKTCNGIEKSAHEVVNSQFAEELKSGRVAWHTENLQEREVLAKRYEVTSSTVVVVEIRGGKEVAFERLDMVWELTGDVEALQKYVAITITQHLKPGGSPQ